MEILSEIQKLKELGMSTKDKQQIINVSEVFHLWNHLTQRYYIIYITDIFEYVARDEDLLLVIKAGKKTLSNHVEILEKEMLNYGIPLPNRPPKQSQPIEDIEEFSDRYIYRRILQGIQSFLPTYIMALIHSTSPKIRDLFISFLVEEIKLYDKFLEYGKLKGYLLEPPTYK